MTVYFKTSRSADRFGETDLLLDSDIVFGKDIRTYAVTACRFDRAVVRLTPGKATVTIAGGEVCPVLALATDRYDDTLVRRFCDEQTRQDFQNSDRSSDHERMLIYHTLNRMADILGLDDPDSIVDRHFCPEAFMPAPATPSLFGTEDQDDCKLDFDALCEVNLGGHLTVTAKNAAQAAEIAIARVEANLDEEVYTEGVLMLFCDGVDVAEVEDLGQGQFNVSLRLRCSGDFMVTAADDDEAERCAEHIIDSETEGLSVVVSGVTFRLESASVTDVEWL